MKPPSMAGIVLMARVKRYATIILVASVATFGVPAGAAQPEPDNVTLNFVNADIEGVVKAVSQITGKNFVLDPRVKGVVNVISASPISRSLVYDVFLSALRLQGYSALEEGGVVKIVPESDAKLHYSPTLSDPSRRRGSGDQIQTQVFSLRHESASQLVPILRPLISPNNTVTAYPNNNTLVVTDYASNLRRIERIIESIDQPPTTEPAAIPLRHASALDVAQTVNRLFAEAPQAAGGTPQPFTVIADARSNSLLVRSSDPARVSQLRKFLATLDSPTSAAGNIHVVYLKNAEAIKVAETLRGIHYGDTGAQAPRNDPVSTTTAPGQSRGATPTGLRLTSTTGSSTATTQAGSSPANSGIILADAATNSIIITAPDPIYNNLRAVLEKLDVRRAQVYVEALIAEITAEKAAEFGIQWQDLSGVNSNDARFFGGTNFGNPASGQNIIGIAQNPGSAGRGLNIGVIKGTIAIPGIDGQILNLGLLVRALERDNNANILSTPTLLTLDNEEATIVVGQNIPIVTGSYAVSSAATTPTPFQTFERKDVGLTLRIRPMISEGGTVRLKLYQEVSSVRVRDESGTITDKRSVESTVLVDDGQIVVIGGLIQDSVNDGIEKVPLLGDLPLLGALFQYKTRSRTKTNLMVFLRPTLLRDAQGAQRITNERYDYIVGEQDKVRPAASAVLPPVDNPRLPPRPGAPSIPPPGVATPQPEQPAPEQESPFPPS